jgi:putative transposase
MTRRRYTPEQVIRKLREADRMLAEGKTTVEVARQLEVSENTFYRWRNQYGGMKAYDAKRLKELERENQRLKRIVADQALNIDALWEVAKGRMFLLCQLEAVVGRVAVDGDGGCGASRRR